MSARHSLHPRCFFHAAVCFDDFVESERPARLDTQSAGLSQFDQIPERCPPQVFGLAGVGGKADRGGDYLHRAEIVERPFVPEFTRTRTSPLLGLGTGRCSILRTSGPPASQITAAFIVSTS